LEVTRLTYEILLVLAGRDCHGYGIIKEIASLGGTAPSSGAVYLALQRMRSMGLVDDAAGPPDSTDARRRYCRITDLGRRTAESESRRLARLVQVARSNRLLEE
jgi:DNA-binding PadR family transcriptional regulator